MLQHGANVEATAASLSVNNSSFCSFSQQDVQETEKWENVLAKCCILVQTGNSESKVQLLRNMEYMYGLELYGWTMKLPQ